MEATNLSFVSEHQPTDVSAELNTTGASPGGLGVGLGTGLGFSGFANWFPGPDSPYTPVKAVLIALLLLCVVIVTFIGNVLVCVAVCLVRKLRRPCNYLLVSLAVSDICVAILVMPMALLYEVMGRWDFGRVMCDLWVSFDVLSCTASILNLCMISVDRYYAITKPLEYGVKRTPRRMIACVSLVWLGAACISLPPLLILGNEHDPADTPSSGPPQCIVCQNFGYQIYATLLSFYIPLSVMIVVYYKIFRAARRIVLEERRAQTHLETHSYVAAPTPTPTPTPATNNGCMANNRNSLSSHSLLVEGEGEGDGEGEGPGPGEGGCRLGAGGDGRDAAQPNRQSVLTVRTVSCETSGGASRCFSPRRSDESQCPMLGAAPNRSPTQASASSLSVSVPRRGRLAAAKKAAKAARRSPASTMSLLRQHRHSSSANPANSTNPAGGPPLVAASHTKKLRFALAKERKASTTLGIIMSAFIVCWLPFFVLALVRPFLKDANSIPPSVISLFLWLGYANSLLNPIIYATLNRDFRRPFQQILYFRCGSLNHMMREEFYQSQYGDPDPTPNYYHVTSQCVVGRLTPPPAPPPPPLPPSQTNDDMTSDLASDEETLTSGGLITVTVDGSQRDRNTANESFL